ncbi:hypothetical protein KSP40_PGU015233 [Platanthera guangdongensis]|uniref:Uncharacterized protein n=1 Tax=Platanthera guangdongensis TaxID=2320717 RepID=A0ABR2M9B4_9ASPA
MKRCWSTGAGMYTRAGLLSPALNAATASWSSEAGRRREDWPAAAEVVVENRGGCGIVEGDEGAAAAVGVGGDVVAAGGLIGVDEDVGGLARPQHQVRGSEGFRVGGVDGDDGHRMSGDGDELM